MQKIAVQILILFQNYQLSLIPLSDQCWSKSIDKNKLFIRWFDNQKFQIKFEQNENLVIKLDI